MMKILVGEVESDALDEILEVLGASLEGCRFEIVTDGATCLRRIETELPDVVVMGSDLPVRDGFDVCAFLKKGERTRDIPVLLLLADAGSVGSRRKAIEVGAEDYLPISPDPLDLVVRVKLLLKLKKLQDERKPRGPMDRISPFLAHKLRSPLNSIIGMAELIQKPHYGNLSEKQRSFVEVIASSGYRLVELINEHAADEE